MPALGRPRRAMLGLCLFSALQVQVAQARFETGTIRLSAEDVDAPWQYLGKFGYGIGPGTYAMRAKLREPSKMISTKLEVYLDEDWPQVQTQAKCSQKTTSMARSSQDSIVGGSWSSWVEGELLQNVRPHIWYFALSACRTFDSPLRSNETYDVDFELHLKQHDKSELSIELRHMPKATFAAVLCLSAFLVSFATRCRRFLQTAGSLHTVIKALAVAVAFQWSAQVLHLFHLQHYEKVGVGESSPEAYADVLFMLSQVCFSTLLIMIARGYTLVNSGDDAELRTMKPIATMIVLLHVALVGHGKMQGDHSEKHHENEGAVGLALVAVRLLLFSWFALCMRQLHQQTQSSFKLQSFLKHFQLAGSMYFLSYPVLFVVVQIFAPYLRHPVMHIGLAAMQSVAALWLSDLFLSKGAYYQASSLSSSLLPGGACGARIKAD